MHKKILAAAAAVALMFSMPAYAGVMDGNFQEWNGMKYVCTVPITMSSAKMDFVAGSHIQAKGYPGISMYMCDEVSCVDTEEKSQLFLTDEEFRRMDDAETTIESWVKTSLPAIVPDATPVDNVPEIVAHYVADHMSYYDTDATIYQSALPAITEGRGVCATYTMFFNSLVYFTPYNPATGLVDYAGGTSHLDVQMVCNEDHGWSAVKGRDGVWREYDVTSYDGTRDERYISGTILTTDINANGMRYHR